MIPSRTGAPRWVFTTAATALAAVTALTWPPGTIVTRAAQEQRAFRAGTDLVVLTVTVTDSAGRLVSGLKQADFQVFEDQTLQEVSLFSSEQPPIALSLLIDSSTSMDMKLGLAQQGAIGLAHRLRPADTAQVIDFDSRPIIRQTFTSDALAVERAIRAMQPGGSTSLYTALYIALTELNQARPVAGPDLRRQAAVVLSDGEDTTSLVDYEQVLDLARRSFSSVYAIGLRTPEPKGRKASYNEAAFVLRTLSEETGGRVFFVEEVRQLPAVYGQIADELANQYVIGYRPKNLKRDGAWRKLHVRLTDGRAQVRTRAGYFAPEGAQ